ncbi:dihydrofolate reductase [Tetragenococcus halophilus subsp. flandriensis]|uniref:dihydrofolate reductase family protein n=1 Tax=Tetragenococcus halophilus TaxID=51669 RepID=UPI0023E930B6|nr:dihydrofolate reductase family protein [Tetragenococcus halophilus]GMA08787.1 dihydrofolate reductase [Tetragenococcus halophilus subsp. flandriensis]
MRKIAFYGAISLDGFLSDEQDGLQWLFDTELGGASTYESFEKQVDTIVMGNITYQEAKKMTDDASFYPNKEKIIFSHTEKGSWEEGRFVSGDIVDILNSLRKQEGKMIWVVGGGSIVKPLLEADMMDEYWIQIAPVLLGKGKRLFEEGDYNYRLEFVETTQMGELTELHLRKKVENDLKS